MVDPLVGKNLVESRSRQEASETLFDFISFAHFFGQIFLLGLR